MSKMVPNGEVVKRERKLLESRIDFAIDEHTFIEVPLVTSYSFPWRHFVR